MAPKNSAINNHLLVTSPNLQRTTNSMSEEIITAPMNDDPQQPPVIPQRYIINSSIGQNAVSIPNHIVVMVRICLVLGIITIIGTVLGLGLFLFSQEKITGLMMMFAMRYSLIIPVGTLVCIATIIAIITARGQYHISVKKPILTVVYSALMIYAPVIIIGLFAITEMIFVT